MPTTTPDAIYFADSSTSMSAEAISAAEATSVQDAFTAFREFRQIQTFVWADAAERALQAGMSEGDMGYQSDTKIYYLYNGASWKAWESDWITYTPTLTNVVLGTGAATEYRYRYVGGVVEVDFFIRLGTGGSFSGSPTMTLPGNAVALRHNNMTYDGVASATNAAGNIYPISVLANTTAVGSVWFWTTTSGAYAQVTATVPHTWALNSAIQGKFRFVPA